MRRVWLLGSLILLSSVAFSQKIHVGVFGGLSAYQGDLTEKIFPKKVTNGAIGVTVNYEWMEQVMIRAGYTYTVVGGADRFSNNDSLLARNLAFETKINEFSLVGEYYFFNLYNQKFSPYIFGGLAVFHFDPYAFNGSTQKIFLKPLSTEGQGLSQYPDRKPYSLTQLALPFGGGIKYAFTDNLRIGLELGMRKLFTDYLDDLSSSYVDPNDLLAAKGQLAVDMSYRGDELPGGNPNYPSKGAQRGGATHKDWYYFLGLHVTYRLGGGDNNTRSGVFGGGRFKGGKKRGYGCPTVPL
jgi:opacity protein-like surface antigen